MDRTSSPVLSSALARFRGLKQLGEGALAQLDLEGLKTVPAGGTGENSVSILVRHMSGNMRSRWSDFLTSDGEKPDRNRDREFEDDFASRDEIFEHWEAGWSCLFGALEPLTDLDLSRTITIRGEPHTVLEAIDRQLVHYAYHVGQIVTTARWILGDAWTSLSIPRGDSSRFNEQMRDRFGIGGEEP